MENPENEASKWMAHNPCCQREADRERAIWDMTVHQRTIVRDKVAWQWLANRKDLVKYIPVLVDVSYFGWGSFATTVSMLCHMGGCDLWDRVLNIRMTSQCMTCFLKTCSKWKLACRATSDIDADGTEVFKWQYIEQLLGSFTLKHFREKDDREERVNYHPTAIHYIINSPDPQT
eukprot:3597468-Amphidinium_carterae.1